jgi:hypothetical protein
MMHKEMLDVHNVSVDSWRWGTSYDNRKHRILLRLIISNKLHQVNEHEKMAFHTPWASFLIRKKYIDDPFPAFQFKIYICMEDIAGSLFPSRVPFKDRVNLHRWCKGEVDDEPDVCWRETCKIIRVLI